MPLLAQNNTINDYKQITNAQTGATNPLANGNASNGCKYGSCTRGANSLSIGQGNEGFLFVKSPQEAGNSVTITYGVVSLNNHAHDVYVISDQYGGCAWHILHHPGNNELAFLHVTRDQPHGQPATLAPYTKAAGWQDWNGGAHYESMVCATAQMSMGNIISLSCVSMNNGVLAINTQFCRLRVDRLANPPINVVTDVDNGLTPYQSANHLNAVAANKACCVLF